MGVVVKILALPVVREALGKVLSGVFRGGATKAKVAAPGTLVMLVGAIVSVISVLAPELGTILAEYDINGLVIGLVGLVTAIVGYLVPEKND